jgi:LemA protein
MKKSLLYVIGALVIVVFLFGGMYNGLLVQKQALDNSWSQVETQYQRRFDLIPNIQATVAGAAEFEKSTFTEVVEARTKWLAAGSTIEKVQAINTFDSALSRLLVTVESYPQLKATEAFRDFMVQLEGTENRIAVSRKDYNDQVETYNVYVQTFPRVLLAKLFGYTTVPYFNSAADADKAPKVSF